MLMNLSRNNQFNCIVDQPRNALAPQNRTSILGTADMEDQQISGAKGVLSDLERAVASPA
jgi:hypothetical protein